MSEEFSQSPVPRSFKRPLFLLLVVSLAILVFVILVQKSVFSRKTALTPGEGLTTQAPVTGPASLAPPGVTPKMSDTKPTAAPDPAGKLTAPPAPAPAVSGSPPAAPPAPTGRSQ